MTRRTGRPKGPAPYPVRIRDQDFPSVAAAALALGLSRNSIYGMLARGRADRIGTGLCRPRNRNAGKPLQIGPHRYATQREAARALSVCPSLISRLVRTRNAEALLALALHAAGPIPSPFRRS